MKRKDGTVARVQRLPQLCFHGRPDTAPCADCVRDGGCPVGESKIKPGPYHMAEIITLVPANDQWHRPCDAPPDQNTYPNPCSGFAEYLAAWWVGLARRRQRLCEHDMRVFCKKARIKAPDAVNS